MALQYTLGSPTADITGRVLTCQVTRGIIYNSVTGRFRIRPASGYIELDNADGLLDPGTPGNILGETGRWRGIAIRDRTRSVVWAGRAQSLGQRLITPGRTVRWPLRGTLHDLLISTVEWSQRDERAGANQGQAPLDVLAGLIGSVLGEATGSALVSPTSADDDDVKLTSAVFGGTLAGAVNQLAWAAGSIPFEDSRGYVGMTAASMIELAVEPGDDPVAAAAAGRILEPSEILSVPQDAQHALVVSERRLVAGQTVHIDAVVPPGTHLGVTRFPTPGDVVWVDWNDAVAVDQGVSVGQGQVRPAADGTTDYELVALTVSTLTRGGTIRASGTPYHLDPEDPYTSLVATPSALTGLRSAEQHLPPWAVLPTYQPNDPRTRIPAHQAMADLLNGAHRDVRLVMELGTGGGLQPTAGDTRSDQLSVGTVHPYRLDGSDDVIDVLALSVTIDDSAEGEAYATVSGITVGDADASTGTSIITPRDRTTVPTIDPEAVEPFASLSAVPPLDTTPLAEGGSAGRLLVTLDEAAPDDIDVLVQVSGGSSFGVADGIRVVEITSGQTTGSLGIVPEDDSDDEQFANVTARIVEGRGYKVPPRPNDRVSFVIQDDDLPAIPPSVGISGPASVAKGSAAVFALTLTSPAGENGLAVRVSLSLSPLSPPIVTTGDRTVFVAPGEASAALEVAVGSVNVGRGTAQTLTATLAAGTGYVVAPPPNNDASVTILDEAPPVLPSVTVIGPASARLGETVRFTVAATSPAPSTGSGRLDPPGFNVNVNLTGGSRGARWLRTGGASFSSGSNGTVNIAPGRYFATLDVETLDITGAGSSLTARVTARRRPDNFAAASPPHDSHTVNISATAPVRVPKISVSAPSTAVGGTDVAFTIASTADAPEGGLVVRATVSISPTGGTVTTSTRSVQIPRGEDNARVAVRAPAAGGSITVSLASGTGYVVVAPPRNAATVAVTASDTTPTTPVIRISAADTSVTEGDDIVLRVSATPAPTRDINVRVAISTSGGSHGVSTAPRTIRVRSGATTGSLTLSTTDDGTDEPDGTVIATLQTVSGGGYAVSQPPHNMVTITVADDDTAPVRIPSGPVRGEEYSQFSPAGTWSGLPVSVESTAIRIGYTPSSHRDSFSMTMSRRTGSTQLWINRPDLVETGRPLNTRNVWTQELFVTFRAGSEVASAGYRTGSVLIDDDEDTDYQSFRRISGGRTVRNWFSRVSGNSVSSMLRVAQTAGCTATVVVRPSSIPGLVTPPISNYPGAQDSTDEWRRLQYAYYASPGTTPGARRYVQGSGQNIPGRPTPVVVVIHTPESGSRLAEPVVEVLLRQAAGYHVLVGSDETIWMARPGVDTVFGVGGARRWGGSTASRANRGIAGNAGHENNTSLHVSFMGRARDSASIPTAMLREGARITAGLCDEWGIPRARISGAQYDNGEKGVIGHSDIEAANVDPGSGFPWTRFMQMVVAA